MRSFIVVESDPSVNSGPKFFDRSIVKTIILSKDSESTKEGTDVFTSYSKYADGIEYYNLSDKSMYEGKVLTTRSNGTIYIIINQANGFDVATEKASPNHTKIGETR